MAIIEGYTINYLFDSSALLCYLLAEPDGKKILKLKVESAIPFVAITELYYILWHKTGKEKADFTLGLVKSWHLPLLFPDEHLSILAGYLKASYDLSLSDSYIASFCLDKNLTLLTKDRDYEILKNDIKILYLYNI